MKKNPKIKGGGGAELRVGQYTNVPEYAQYEQYEMTKCVVLTRYTKVLVYEYYTITQTDRSLSARKGYQPSSRDRGVAGRGYEVMNSTSKATRVCYHPGTIHNTGTRVASPRLPGSEVNATRPSHITWGKYFRRRTEIQKVRIESGKWTYNHSKLYIIWSFSPLIKICIFQDCKTRRITMFALLYTNTVVHKS